REQLGLHLAASGEDGAAGHPSLTRRRRGSRGADRRVGAIDLHALDPKLGARDLGADGYDPLPDFGGGRVDVHDRPAGIAREAHARRGEAVEAVRVADVLESRREPDATSHALAASEVA